MTRNARALAKAALLSAFLLAVSLVFIALHSHVFGYRRMIIPLHMALVSAIFVTFVVALGLMLSVRRFRQWPGSRYAIAGLCALAAATLWSLYIMDHVASRAWGQNLSWSVIASSVTAIPAFVRAMPYPAPAIYGLALLFFAAVLAFFLFSSRIIREGLQELVEPDRPFSLFRTKLRMALTVLCLCGLAGAFAVFMNATLQSKRNLWEGEPLVGLFKTKQLIFGDSPLRRTYAEEDRRLRATYPRVPSFDRKNVILIASDSMRAAHMQVYGYNRPTTPFLSSWAETGRLHKVKACASVACESLCGVLGLLASRDPMHVSKYNFMLQDLLKHEGYKTYFLLAHDNTTWYGYRELIGRNEDLFFDGTMTKRYTVSDDRLIFEGLEQVPPYDGTPALFFFFLMSTHFAGVKLDEYNVYRPSKVDTSVIESMWLCVNGDYDQTAMVNRYDNGILQADAMIEKIVHALQAKGYFDNSITVVTADHGEALGEHGHYTHSRYLNEEDIGIPILFYDAPGVTYANLEYAWQPDIAVTLLSRLGLPVPASWQGRSLLDPPPDRFTYHCTQRNPTLRAIIQQTSSKRYKYIVQLPPWGQDQTVPEHEWLFDLTSDRGETRSVLDTAEPQLLSQLREQMKIGFRSDR